MSRKQFLMEIQSAVLAGCPVTVESIVAALDRLTDNTVVGWGAGDYAAVALLRGHVPSPVKTLVSAPAKALL